MRARAVLLALYAIAGAAYLVWRAAGTLSGAPPVYAGLFLLAEVHLYLSSLAFYRLLSAPGAPSPATPEPSVPFTVDVLIPTYREDVALLRSTARAARDLRGPHTTWLCDDAARPEVQALADALGVGYLSRPSNTDFKAGNLNHALEHVSGDLVLVLDADHVPREGLLDRLVPFFGDPRVGFVQVPQVYWNADSFQHVPVAGRSWHESAVFHHRLQPGAARDGGPLFVGTGAVLRRAALDRIGGFATGSITEDVLTGQRLHAAGYRSVFVDEAWGVLLAPQTPFAYARQRLRWAQGAMQILRREPPVFARLRPWQRVNYLAALTGFLAAWPNVLFFVAPALYLLFGVAPVSVDPAIGAPVIALHVVLDLVVYQALVAPQARLLLGERFKVVNLPIQLRATWRLLVPEGAVFQVTPKGPHRGLPAWLLVAPVALLVLDGSAVGVGLARIGMGDGHPGALAIAVALAWHYAMISGFALGSLLGHRNADAPVSIPVDVAVTVDGAPGRVVRLAPRRAWLSETGVPDTAVVLDLEALGVAGPVAGRIAEDGARVDLAPSPAQDAALDRALFERLVPAWLAGCGVRVPDAWAHAHHAGSGTV